MMASNSRYLELHTSVLKLVDSGNDDALHDWLRVNKLMHKSSKCKNCSSNMSCIVDTRNSDRHKWICTNSLCSNTGISLSIRHSSFFENCPKNISLFDIFKLILLWCEDRSIDSIDFDSEKQKKNTKQVFLVCDKVADIHIRNVYDGKTVVGGNHDDKLILMDTFPSGYIVGKNSSDGDTCTKMYSTHCKNQFLCLADMGFVPPMVWVHLLRQGNKIPLLARTLVHPDSIIVTNSRVASAQLLQEAGLRALDVETLQTLDTPQQKSICNDLGTIWKNVIPVLTAAEHLPMTQARLLLNRFLWHQRYGASADQALYNLLLQVIQQFPIST